MPGTARPLPPRRWSPRGWSLRGWSLRTRLVAALVALLAVVCAAVGTATVVELARYQLAQVDVQLRATAQREPRGGFRPDGGERAGAFPGFTGCEASDAVAAAGLGVLGAPGQPSGALAAVEGPDGVSAGYLQPTGSTLCPVLLGAGAAAVLADVPADGVPRTVAVPRLGDYRVVAVADDDGGGRVVLSGLPLSRLQATQHRLVLVVLVVSALALLVAGLLAAAIVRGALRPLRRVAATAAAVSRMRLGSGEVDIAVRVPPQDTDTRTEVGQVGAALDSLLTNVGAALEARHDSETRVRQFVADASHELRTPLSSIRGYAELIRRTGDDLPPVAAHAVGRVESEARRMTGLVEDLLLLARLDAGRPLERAPVDLTQLVVDALSDAAAAGRDHTWRLDVPDEPVEVVGDAARLQQVLVNLLTNARTHTPPGTTVTASLRTSTPGQVVLAVLDDGPGIPPDLLPHVFDRFARGDSSRSRAAGSSGLGLAIVAAIVASSGGSVDVASRPGQTAFLVRLPLPAPAPAPQEHHRVTTEP